MITIYLGDVSDYLRQHAVLADPDAQLITGENYKNLKSGTYFTSLGDLSNLTVLGDVLQQADRIVYSPPDHWSDRFLGKSQMQTWTEEYLHYFSFYTQVDNFSTATPDAKTSMLDLADQRKTSSQQIWVAGCSYSHGVAIEQDQRYGNLLANQLNLPVSFLTKPGSSVIWAADQILRSDIRQDDLVVWGITSIPRVPYFYNGKLIKITPTNYDQDKEFDQILDFDYFTSQDIEYRSVVAMFQTINYCKKIKAKLLLVSMIDNGTLFKYIKDEPVEHLMLYKIWGRDTDNIIVDLGSDSVHPGPKTHQCYANLILKRIKKLNW
jgi:hypothetical protein